MKIHDISIPITPTMPVYPGDPAVRIEPMLRIEQGDAANVSLFAFGNHTGTHVDPPAHFIPGGKTIDQLDLNVLCGRARVVDFTRLKTHITAADLARAKIPARVTRVLFKTRNSATWDRAGFQRDFIALTPDAAQWIVAHGIQLVGIDYLSVEAFDSPEPLTHRTLLGAGVIVVEGLNLRGIKAGMYTLACLPLKVKDGDGSPARVILFQA